jgi:peptide/nickel transport system substrate-binding protein
MKLKLFPLVGYSVIALMLVCLLLLLACAPKSTTTTPATAAPTTTSTTTSPQTTTKTTTTTAATQTTTSASQKQYGGVLKIVNRDGPSSTFGWPATTIDTGGVLVMGLCYENFVHMEVSGNIVPWLATAWQLGPDKKSFTLTLRKNVKFQDGSDFNANVAKFNLDAYISANQSITRTWQSVDVVDDYTVRINLKSFVNTMPGDLASVYIVSQTAYNTKGLDWLKANPVGTGPFQFVSLTRDVKTVFKKFDNYWQKGKPYLDGIEYHYITDAMTQSLSLQAGDEHVLTQPSISVGADLLAKKFNVLAGGTQAARALVPDGSNADSPYSNLKVRQALDYAIDKDAIAKSLGYGFLKGVHQLADPATNAYISNLANRTYNVNKAKQLLAEAGFPNGFKTSIIPNPSIERDAGVAVQGYLAAVGITADVQNVDFPKFVEMRLKGWKNALLIQPMPSSVNFASMPGQFYFATTSTQLGPSLLKPQALLDLINTALAADTADSQKTLNQQMNQMIFDQAMVIPLYALGQGIFAWSPIVQDAGFCYGSYWPAWHPDDVWMSK